MALLCRAVVGTRARVGGPGSGRPRQPGGQGGGRGEEEFPRAGFPPLGAAGPPMGARESFTDAAGVGWEMYRDAQSQADYFYNTETQQSTWRDPRRPGKLDPLGGARTLKSNLPHLAGLGLLFFGLIFLAVGARV